MDLLRLLSGRYALRRRQRNLACTTDGSDPQAVLPPAIDDFSYKTFTSDDTQGVFSVAPTGEYIVRVVKVAGPDIGPGVPSEQTHLFLYDLVSGTVRQLTFGASFDQWPSISPDGQTVAFIRSAYHAEKGSDGTFHVGQANLVSTQSRFPAARLGGCPPDLWPAELNCRGSRTGRSSTAPKRYRPSNGQANPVRPPRPRVFFDALSSTWTPVGLLYVGDYNLFDPSHGGTSAGRPPSGLYLASKPVRLKGRLLRRYRYPERSPVPNGLFSVHLMPGTTTVVAQYKNQVVTRPLTGGASKCCRFREASLHDPRRRPGPKARANPRCSTRRDRPGVRPISGRRRGSV